MREYRGTLTQPGKNSPLSRPHAARRTWICFLRMKNGRVPGGFAHACAPRSTWPRPNINMRDPAIYRIKLHARTIARATSGASTRCTTSRTRSAMRWRASPTPSARWNTKSTARCMTGWCNICQLASRASPRQIEFARLNMTHTVMSKRYLRRLVEERLRLRLGRPAYAHAVLACAAAATPAAADARFHRAAWA